MEKKSNLYIIRNKVNNKIYLGSSISINQRKSAHFRELKKGCHHSRYLQRSYNKYGKENFEFIVIGECPASKQLKIETMLICLFKPEYNMTKDAFAPMLGKKHSENTKKKFKNRKNISGKDHYLYGKKMPRKTVNKIIKANTGKKRSEEFKRKRSVQAKNDNRWSYLKGYIKSKQEQICDSNGRIFQSLVECSNFHNISISVVCDILKGRHYKTRSGISFCYGVKFIPKKHKKYSRTYTEIELYKNKKLIKKFSACSDVSNYLKINRRYFNDIIRQKRSNKTGYSFKITRKDGEQYYVK